MIRKRYATIVLWVAVFLLLISFAPQNKANAAVNVTSGAGWDIWTSGPGDYRYGPAYIVNDDNSIDMWTCSPGNYYFLYENFTRTGDHSAVSIAGTNVAAQKFTTTKDFHGVQVLIPTWHSTTSGGTLKLFKWNTDYNTTVSGTPLATQAFSNIPDNSYINLDTQTLYAGTYVWTFSNAVNSVGIWKYEGSHVTGNVNYMNGSTVTGDYEVQINYNSWDNIRTKHSTDGGVTWGTESVALAPTLLGDDHYAACDPGVVKFGGYYYMGYTSTKDNRATANEVYVARGTSPTGPWEKWNGSGWGGNPVSFIKYTGDPIYYGAGEPSFVVVDNTLYIYYSLITLDANNRPVTLTMLKTASTTNANWPGSLTDHGVALLKREDQGMDSLDVKYVDAYGKFIAVNTARRLGPKSYVKIWESTDGLSFHPSNMGTVDLQPYLHNSGISGDKLGHIDVTKNNFIGYAYGPSWGTWNLHLNPISLSNNNLPAKPDIYSVQPNNGQIRLEFQTDSAATSYNVKYGTTSGVYTTTITGVTASPYRITGLTNGTRYYIAVEAVNANGTSGASAQVSAIPQVYSAIGLTATASSQLTGWEASKAVDGNVTTAYSSQSHDAASATEWIYVDAGSNKNIGRLVITSRLPDNQNAPQYGNNVKIQISNDATTWFDTDYRSNAYSVIDDDSWGKYVVDYPQPFNARYIRIYATSLGMDSFGGHYLQLGEIQAYTLPVSTFHSTAYPGWESYRMLDYDVNTVYSSSLHASAAFTEWAGINLGSVQQIKGISLTPRPGGFGFPVDFKLQSSNDGTTWTDISGMSFTSYPAPGNTVQAFNFTSPVNAQYFRVYATKLSNDGINNYALQIAQMVLK